MNLHKNVTIAGLLSINLLTLLDRRNIKENGLHASVWLLTLFIYADTKHQVKDYILRMNLL